MFQIPEKPPAFLSKATWDHLRQLLTQYLTLETALKTGSPSRFALCGDQSTWTVDAIRTKAEESRLLLRSGDTPILDLIALLENHGLRVIVSPMEAAICGFSLITAPHGITLFLNSQDTAERKIFTLAHELGHLVLHRFTFPKGSVSKAAPGTEALTLMEKEADTFAAEFLMPLHAVKTYADHLQLQPATWTYLILLNMKSRFGVSAETLLRRLLNLNIISKASYKHIDQQIKEHYEVTRFQEPSHRGHIPQLSENIRLFNLTEIAVKNKLIKPGDALKIRLKFGF